MPSDTGVKPANNTPDSSDVLYRLLFEHCMDGIMTTAPDGTILDANPAACKIFGRTREEVIVAAREGLIDSSDPRLPALVEQRRLTGKAHGELIGRRKDGSFFPAEFSSVIFQSPTGEARTCLIIRDISERREAETQRERLIQELQGALARVNTLSGLLPMCAACRKIRDKEGSWHHLEFYIRKHTEADFSHGICPECRLQWYPENP